MVEINMSESLKLDTPAYGNEVIEAFGQSPTAMTASRAAGYQFLYGTKTTLRHYMQWREANPKFRVTSYVNAHSKPKDDEKNGSFAKGHSQRRRGPRGATVRNRGGR
jgi:hypothetical protein